MYMTDLIQAYHQYNLQVTMSSQYGFVYYLIDILPMHHR